MIKQKSVQQEKFKKDSYRVYNGGCGNLKHNVLANI
jgi:hypothetical protein